MSAAPTPIEIPEGFDTTVPHLFVWLGEEGRVTGRALAFMPQPGATEVSEEVFAQIQARGGSARLVDGVVEDYEPPAEPERPPEQISDRQFFQQLALDSVISREEALDAVRTGAIPAALGAILGSLPADQQFEAEMTVSGATTFSRHHPLTLMVQQAMGWDDAKLDTFWKNASAL